MIKLSLSDLLLISKHGKLLLSKRFVIPSALFLLAIASFSLFEDEKIIATILLLLSFVFLWQALKILGPAKKWLHETEQLISECIYDEAEERLEKAPYWLGPAGKLKALELQLRLYDRKGDVIKEYDTLQRIEAAALLPTEVLRWKLAKAGVLHREGNYRDFRGLLDQTEIDASSNTEVRKKYEILRSFAFETLGDYENAKRTLTDLIRSDEKFQCTEAFTNLGRLEAIFGNLGQASHYFEKAKDALKTENDHYLTSLAFQNLIFLATQKGKEEKAKKLLSEYRELIHEKNKGQFLDFLNVQIELARQLGDIPLLLRAYALIDFEVSPRLSDTERLALLVSEIRMRLADPLFFSEQIIKLDIYFDALMNLPFPENYIALKEAINVLQQLTNPYIRSRLPACLDSTIQALQSRCFEPLKSICGTIGNYRKTIPELLVGKHFYWIKETVFISRLLHSAQENYPEIIPLNDILDSLCEVRRHADEMQNPRLQIEALMMLCEIHISQENNNSKQEEPSPFKNAKYALAKSEELLIPRLQDHSYGDLFIGQAFFEIKITGNKSKAKEWLQHFENLKINPNHFAPWLRSQYMEIISELKQPA